MSVAFGRNFPDSRSCFPTRNRRAFVVNTSTRTLAMRVDSPTPDTPAVRTRLETKVTISPWVNERYPPVNDLLSSRDVARLTRRSRWVLTGLSLIGRFPKRLKFRGRAIGWCRSEILDWMSRDLTVVRDGASRRFCSRKHPRQACLPLECTTPSMPSRKCPSRPPLAACKNRSRATPPERACRGEIQAPIDPPTTQASEHVE